MIQVTIYITNQGTLSLPLTGLKVSRSVMSTLNPIPNKPNGIPPIIPLCDVPKEYLSTILVPPVPVIAHPIARSLHTLPEGRTIERSTPPQSSHLTDPDIRLSRPLQ